MRDGSGSSFPLNPDLRAAPRAHRAPHAERHRGRDPPFQKVVRHALQHRPQGGVMPRGMALDLFEQAVVQFHNDFHAIHPLFYIGRWVR